MNEPYGLWIALTPVFLFCAFIASLWMMSRWRQAHPLADSGPRQSVPRVRDWRVNLMDVGCWGMFVTWFMLNADRHRHLGGVRAGSLAAVPLWGMTLLGGCFAIALVGGLLVRPRLNLWEWIRVVLLPIAAVVVWLLGRY